MTSVIGKDAGMFYIIRKVVAQWVSKLTAKQEKYVQGLVAGLSQREAYKEAGYKVSNMTNQSIDSVASRLLRNVKVLSRYRELLKEHSNMTLWTREAAFNEYEWLKNRAKKDIQQDGVRQATANAFLDSLEGMNQMAFRDLELADKKILAEIERLEQQIGGTEEQDDKITGYINKLKDVISDE